MSWNEEMLSRLGASGPRTAAEFSQPKFARRDQKLPLPSPFTYFEEVSTTSRQSEALCPVVRVIFWRRFGQQRTLKPTRVDVLGPCALGENFRDDASRSSLTPQPTPHTHRRIDPKFQCSPLSQAKKYKTTQTKLQRVYYQLSLDALVQKVWRRAESDKLVVPELQQTVRGFKLFSLSSKMEKKILLVLLLPASESSCLWSLHCKWIQSQ